MKQTVLALALGAVAATASFSASADELKYNYVEADYSDANFKSIYNGIQSVDPDLSGFTLRGSLLFGESFYGFGSYSYGSGDLVEVLNGPLYADANFDLDRWNLGVGYRKGLSDKVDFVTELSYLNYDVTAKVLVTDGFGSWNYLEKGSYDGLRLGAGLRGKLSESFEGQVKVNYDDGGDLNGSFNGSLLGVYHFSDVWGVVGEFEVGEDYTGYNVGVRASF